MRKLFIVALFPLIACNHIQTKQEKAEIAVKKYLHVDINSDSSKNMSFTKLSGNEIGLINGATFKLPIDMGPNKGKSIITYQTLWFELDTSCNKVKFWVTR